MSNTPQRVHINALERELAAAEVVIGERLIGAGRNLRASGGSLTPVAAAKTVVSGLTHALSYYDACAIALAEARQDYLGADTTPPERVVHSPIVEDMGR